MRRIGSSERLRGTPPGDAVTVTRTREAGGAPALWGASGGSRGSRNSSPERRQGVVLDSQLQEASAMLNGFGIALMSPLFWAADLASGRLVQPFEMRHLKRENSGNADWMTGWSGERGYEVYLRSFADSDGDGIGDLPGLTAKLDYLADLGVGVVWVTPWYPSPLRDHGYDVADYCAIAPEYGDLDDLDAGPAARRVASRGWSSTSR